MSRVALRPSVHSPDHPVFKATWLIRQVAASLLLVGITIWVPISTFAQSVYVDYNPCCTNDTVSITVLFPGTCASKEHSWIHAKVNGHPITLTRNTSYSDDYGNQEWTGPYYVGLTPGPQTIYVEDSCRDIFTTVTLTVVEVDYVYVSSNPAYSGWTNGYVDQAQHTGNYAASKSPSPGDFVGVELGITPNSALAAELAQWNVDTWPVYGSLGPLSVVYGDNRLAEVAATYTCKPVVTASLMDSSFPSYNYYPTPTYTTPPVTVWIFWGSVDYNFSGDLSDIDGLIFDVVTTNGPYIPYPNPDPKVAGPVETLWTNYQGVPDLLADYKVEIIGTLSPTGVGNVLGDIFEFNQWVVGRMWGSASQPSDNMGYTAGTSTNDSFTHWVTEITFPWHDQIFAIDDPGIHAFPAPVYSYYAQAGNLDDYISINSVPISYTNHWSAFVKCQCYGYGVSAWQNWANYGPYILPATWAGGSGPGDGNWNE